MKRFLMVAAGLAILTALSAASSGCGDGGVSGMWDMGDMGDMHREMHGGGSQGPQTPVASDAPKMTVEIRNFDFFPRELTVKAGTEITWVNRDGAPHDATGRNGDWATPMLSQGESAALTFDSPGAYEYFCTIHPNMKAVLTVA